MRLIILREQNYVYVNICCCKYLLVYYLRKQIIYSYYMGQGPHIMTIVKYLLLQILNSYYGPTGP